MKIVIAGGTGFIGEPLARRLAATNDVAVLSRNPEHVAAGRGVKWDPSSGSGAWRDDVAAADVVINLAGENVGEGRWSAERKRRILESRLSATSALVGAMRTQPSKTRTFISASAVGYYGPRDEEVLDESGTSGGGFLAEVVRKWEEAAMKGEDVSRLVILRFGVVLDREGGALAKMLLPFRLGLGGPLGSGKQWMAWITREDALRIIEWAIVTGAARGIYNATSPEPLRNRDFTRALGRALHRPAFMPVPAFGLRLLFGEMADETLLAGQRAVPARSQREGFVFADPELPAALARLFSPHK